MALADNIVARWAMDAASNATEPDSIGSSDLLKVGSGTVGSTTGHVGGSPLARTFAYVDGATDTCLGVVDNTAVSSGDITISFLQWIYYTSIGDVIGVTFCKDNFAAQREYGAYIVRDTGVPIFYVTSDGSTPVNVTWGGALSTSTWYMLACGHSSTANETWISIDAGTPVTTSHSAGIADGTAGFFVGGSGLGSYAITSRIDETAIFKRDIRSDLASFYNSGSGLAYPYTSSSTIPVLMNQFRQRRA